MIRFWTNKMTINSPIFKIRQEETILEEEGSNNARDNLYDDNNEEFSYEIEGTDGWIFSSLDISLFSLRCTMAATTLLK